MHARDASLWTLSIACALAATTTRARAQDAVPSPADLLFSEAKAFMKAGDTARACETFALSYQLDAAPGTLLNLAACHEKQGKTATALGEFKDAIDHAVQNGKPDREAYARQHYAALEKRLLHLVLRVQAPTPGMEVSIDGKPIPTALVGTPMAVDPAEHTFAATAPGKHTWTRTELLRGEGAQVELIVPPLEDEAQSKPVTAPAAVPTIEPTPPSAAGGSRRTLGIVIGAAGVAGLGLGAVFGLSALSQKSRGGMECTGTYCTARGLDLLDGAGTSATISTIAFAIGAVGVAAGTFVFVTAPSRPQQRAMHLTPIVGAGRIGVRGEF